MADDGAGRRSSDWPLGAEIERAARYVQDVRTARSRAAQLRAATSREGVAAVRAVLQHLPRRPLTFSASPAGEELRTWFRPDRRLPFNRAPIAVLDLPGTPADYLRGRSRQALRTNLTRAAALGLSCVSVPSEDEVRRVAAAIAAGRGTSGDKLVRYEHRPGPQRLFCAAHDVDGTPMGLAQAVLDGPRAGLVLMISFLGHEHARVVRYALHTHLVADLVARGASTVVVGGSMLLTSEGTRYFQRRTGFVPVRVEPLVARHGAAAPSRPTVAPIAVRRSAEAGAARPVTTG
jgi:hypothetical protein